MNIKKKYKNVSMINKVLLLSLSILLILGLVSATDVSTEGHSDIGGSSSVFSSPFNPPTSKDYGFNQSVMTDSNGLTFKTNINGVVTVMDERFLGFALKGTYNGNDYTYTSMDYEWTWSQTINGEDYIFEATNNDPNFVWKQYWYFYQDASKPMKIEHSLKNNYPNPISNMQMYYIITTEDTDVIEYNGTEYIVGDVSPIYIQKDLNHVDASINFNSKFNFDFTDIVDSSFNINEFYLGSGVVIDKPLINIMAVGFTKGTGILNPGQEVLIDPTFSTNEVDYAAVCSIGERTMIIAWVDDPQNDITFAIYDLDGTLEVGPIDADTSVGTVFNVEVVALNSTHFAVGWADDVAENLQYAVYNISGGLVSGPHIVGDTAPTGKAIVMVALNDTHIAAIVNDYYGSNTAFKVFDTSGNILTDVLITSASSLAISAFNETHVIVGTGNIFRIYDTSGNLLVGPITVLPEASIVGRNAMGVAAVNSTHFAITWVNYSLDNILFSVYDSSGSLVSGPTIVDSGYPGNSKVAITAVKGDDKKVVIASLDYVSVDDADVIYTVCGTNGSIIRGPIDVDTTAAHSYVKVASYGLSTGFGFYNDAFVVVYKDQTIDDGIFIVYDIDGSSWTPPPDTSDPEYSDDGHNTTEAGNLCEFSIIYNDDDDINDTGLDPSGQYIFSTNNTGSWVNDSAVNFTSTPEWANVTKTLNSTRGVVVGYRWFANDSAGNYNNTSIFTLTVTNTTPPVPISLSYTSGYYWASFVWSPGVGYVTDSYNVSINGVWTNGSVLNSITKELVETGVISIEVYAYNSTGDGNLSLGSLSGSTTIGVAPYHTTLNNVDNSISFASILVIVMGAVIVITTVGMLVFATRIEGFDYAQIGVAVVSMMVVGLVLLIFVMINNSLWSI